MKLKLNAAARAAIASLVIFALIASALYLNSGLKLEFEKSSFEMPSGKAEIASATPDGKRLVVTEADAGSVSILDISDLESVNIIATVSLKSLSKEAEVTSVAVTPDGRYALAAVRLGDDLENAKNGALAVIDLDEYELKRIYEIGIGPDSVAITKDGRTAVVAIEDQEVDPASGDIDFKKVKRPGSVNLVEFDDQGYLNGRVTEIPIDLSVVKDAVYPNDPQPEYVSVSPDGALAAVTLQENNAVAVVDIASKSVANIFSLGTTEHKSDLRNDDEVRFVDNMKARLEPDGIAWTSDGKHLITANEGDLGKDEFGDGVRSGGRNITIWGIGGEKVYDSENIIDEALYKAELYPDSRSGKNGSEIESVAVAKIKGRDVAALAAERGDAIVFFDVTDAGSPRLLCVEGTIGKSPEGIVWIPESDAFVSCDEKTGTLTFFRIK